MLSVNEKILLSHLRVNSRISLTHVSRIHGIPVSTLFDVRRSLEKRFINKYCTIPDYSALDFPVHVLLVLSVESKISLLDFLVNSKNVNTVSIMSPGYDFLVECMFQDRDELNFFYALVNEFGINEIFELNLYESLKIEAFHLP